MAVVTTWKKIDFDGRFKRVTMLMTYDNGDTSIVCGTGLRNLFGYTCTIASSVLDKTVRRGVVTAGGVVTLLVNDPLAPCYLTLTAWGV
jgi:hypothetical protein